MAASRQLKRPWAKVHPKKANKPPRNRASQEAKQAG